MIGLLKGGGVGEGPLILDGRFSISVFVGFQVFTF
jgi:hypothetical protein